jgi:hypothetical protein
LFVPGRTRLAAALATVPLIVAGQGIEPATPNSDSGTGS